MHPAEPLPPRLVSLGVFTLGEAVAEGLQPGRLRRKDVVRIARGIYAVGGIAHDHVTIAGAVCRMLPNTWIARGTAGTARGLTLPSSVRPDRPEVSRQRPANLPRTSAVRGCRATVRRGEVTGLRGVPVSTPARVWFELAPELSLLELIEFGDHLVRFPRPAFEGRETPFATITELRRITSWHPRVTGADKARAALEKIRVGADSAQETRLRLAMVAAGLPPPELQVQLDPDDQYSPAADLGYRDARVAIDYDGGTHLTPEQQSRDIRRRRAFTSAGWRHITANRQDAREGFRTLIEDVRGLLGGRM